MTYRPARPGRRVSPGQVEMESVSDAVSDVILTLAPWGISALFHAGVLLLALFLVFAYSRPNDRDMEGPVIPGLYSPNSATLDPGVVTDGGLNPSLATRKIDAPSTAAALSRRVDGGDRPFGHGVGRGPDDKGRGSGNPGGGNGGNDGINGWGPGGLGPGGGDDAGSKGNPFAGSVGGQSTIGVFEGHPIHGNVRSLVFVIDASGSLLDTLPFVIDELRRAVLQLHEAQRFTVIFFHGEEVIEVPPFALKPATQEIKERVVHWLEPSRGNVVAMGGSNPVKAIQLALSYRPDQVLLLSDNITGKGRGELDQRRLLAAIREANRHRTRIDTTQYVYPDRLAVEGRRSTMELISDENGGEYRFVSARDLDLR